MSSASASCSTALFPTPIGPVRSNTGVTETSLTPHSNQEGPGDPEPRHAGTCDNGDDHITAAPLGYDESGLALDYPALYQVSAPCLRADWSWENVLVGQNGTRPPPCMRWRGPGPAALRQTAGYPANPASHATRRYQAPTRSASFPALPASRGRPRMVPVSNGENISTAFLAVTQESAAIHF